MVSLFLGGEADLARILLERVTRLAGSVRTVSRYFARHQRRKDSVMSNIETVGKGDR